jgi:glutamate-1-semialdehyde 2,1-aminomutase
MATLSSTTDPTQTKDATELTSSPLVQAYIRRTPKSAAFAERARRVLPSGVTHDVRYIEPHGIYITHAHGTRKWDVDGNEYVDYIGGHGALLLGHCHPEVTAAVESQLHKGTHYGACHELELQWADLLHDMVPSAERVRFTNSGTETTLLGIRLARAFTGRKKILRFIGHFHGWHDHVAFNAFSLFDGAPTAGVLPEIADNVVIAPPWDWEATQRIIEEHDDIAAVLIEPTGSTWGQVPVKPEFLHSLREATAQRGIVLMFDEVVTGFRCASGGAQEALGVTPDLTALGKIVAGAMHGAALVGRVDIMNRLDHRAAAAEGFEKVGHQGTYNAMPTTCAAAVATLQIIKTTDACQRAIDYGRGLQDALDDVFRDEGVNWIAYGKYGGFHVFLNPNNISTTREEIESGKFDYATLCAPAGPGVMIKIRIGCLLHGVDIMPWPGGPISAVHTDEDCHLTAEAFRQTIRMLKDEGDI